MNTVHRTFRHVLRCTTSESSLSRQTPTQTLPWFLKILHTKQTLPSSGNIHYFSSYKSLLIICLTSFVQQKQQYELPVSYRSGMISGHASNMTEKSWSHLSKILQTHILVNFISLLLSCYPRFKIAVPRKVWKIKFNFPPGWYISDWFCAVRIVPVWSECKAVLSLVQPKRKCMLL